MDERKHKKFLAYLNQPVSKESFDIIIKANNLKHDRCVLYKEFIISLIIIITNTYLGEDVTNDEEKINHFNWCWGKNINNFKEEGVSLDENKLYDYFLNFMLETFYLTENNSEYDLSKIIKLWEDLFNLDKQKTNADVDTLTELYKIFDMSLKMY